MLKRSILTEKVARRGFHVMREYAVDPLEATFVREVMDTDIYTVEPDRGLGGLYRALPGARQSGASASTRCSTRTGGLIGSSPGRPCSRQGRPEAVARRDDPSVAVAHPDEILRPVADRMAELGVGVLPVVDRPDPKHLDGLITQFDLLRPARSCS